MISLSKLIFMSRNQMRKKTFTGANLLVVSRIDWKGES